MGGESELRLGLKASYEEKSCIEFLREIYGIEDRSQKLLKIEQVLKCLEEEKKKIETFKGELPKCMLIINDVIEGVRGEEKKCRAMAETAKPSLDESKTVKMEVDTIGGMKSENFCKEKMNWMSSAQLWINDNENSDKNNSVINVKEEAESIDAFSLKRSNAGEFMLSNEISCFPVNSTKEVKVVLSLQDFSLQTGINNTNANLNDFNLNCNSRGEVNIASSSPAAKPVEAAGNIQSSSQRQPLRKKARRCWSPELHRNFVNALKQLGGWQVATPKRIRELMGVEELTNDEVKSHLQKFRLHKRRLLDMEEDEEEKLVIAMGTLWAPDKHFQASKMSTSQSGSPQGPLQFPGTLRGITITGGDSGEDEEGKSESYSWKGHFQI